MKHISYSLLFLLALLASSCQEKNIDIAPMVLTAPDGNHIIGQLIDDDYTWTWPTLSNGKKMFVSLYAGGTIIRSDTINGNKYTQHNIATNVPYTYVFKTTDGINLSNGIVKTYLREGASKITGVQMAQVEKESGYDASVSWTNPDDATSILLTASNGVRTLTETLPASINNYTINDVTYGDSWNVILRAVNDKGYSLPVSSNLKIGKTAMAFLSTYASPEELVANGDDDEASAWLWMHNQYPTAKFLYFGNIKSRADIDAYRVMFWLRDLEHGSAADVWRMPEAVMSASNIIKDWYKAGGNLLLWQHATPYIATLGRIDQSLLKNNDHVIGIGKGNYNGDTWAMALSLNAGGNFIDFSSHPIYKNLPVQKGDNGLKILQVKGPGWTEDHNCLYFNIPSALTGKGNQDLACYTELTHTYGIYPLGVWDSQVSWISQFNVWEARQGNTDYKGTVICIGNGGCEFSMKNADGSADKSMSPKNNIYQSTILQLAKNCLEYLKTK